MDSYLIKSHQISTRIPGVIGNITGSKLVGSGFESWGMRQL